MLGRRNGSIPVEQNNPSRTNESKEGKEMTPHEAFTGQRPDISRLVTWGCIGVSHINKEDRYNGMSDRGEYVGMLSYDPTIHGMVHTLCTQGE